MLHRALLVLAAAGLASPAAAEVPFTFSPGTTARAADVNANFAYLDARSPRVYWAKSPTYDSDVTLTATATQWVANVDHPLAIGALTLPPGSYVLSGKIGYYKGTAVFGGLECVLGDPGGSGIAEYASHGAECNGTVNLQLPITLATTTTVTFACHLWAQNSAGGAGTGHVWGGRIYAVSVASITQQ